MAKIDLKRLASKAEIVKFDGPDGTITLEIKPLPFKKFMSLVDEQTGADVIGLDGVVDKVATREKQFDATMRLVTESLLISYPDMTREEINEQLQFIPAPAFKTLNEAIIRANGMGNELEKIKAKQFEKN